MHTPKVQKCLVVERVRNLRPCDFVSLSFGNVTDNPLLELWFVMNQKVGKPCSTCMAFELRHQLNKKTEQMPFDEKESTEIIESRKPIEVIPEYYWRLVK